MAFRRKWSTTIWHWCPECSMWPDEISEESESAPTAGQLCNECQVKSPLFIQSRDGEQAEPRS